MADIRTPPITAMGAAKDILSGIKSKIPKNLPKGPSEKLQFAKHARGRDGGALSTGGPLGDTGPGPTRPIGAPGDMEMQAVNNVDPYPAGVGGTYVGPTEGYMGADGTYVSATDGGMVGQMGDGSGMAPGPGGTAPPPTLKRGESTWSESTVGVEGGHDMIDEWQAGWNVTNAIQGMFIVSLPYAVLHGGYWALVAMIGIAYICCYTGKILVDCLYEVDQNGQLQRVRHSYKAVARAVFGKQFGGEIVQTAQLIELLMTCILYVVLCGDLMIGSFPNGPIDARSWMVICGMFLLPCGYLRNLHHVSTLSFWCMVTHIVINIIIFGYCLACAPNWAWSKVRFRIDFVQFPIALGVIVFSYTSHIFLPTLERNMIDRSKFTNMLNWSHIAAASFKSLFGYLGYLTWADDTEEVITNNLENPSFKGIVNIILVTKALLSYPLPFYAAVEIIERSYFRGKPTTVGPSALDLDGELKVWALALRTLIVVGTILMAIFIPHFAILMGLIGSFTGTMLSFIWPCYFHLKLKAGQLEWHDIAYNWFVIFLGFLFGIIGISTSFYALVEAFQIGLPF
ncbi:Amino acid transporter transmembrane domain [Trinorchestia longiramus]|nr:Amino acid transporter transmembrane domain [Trinorchestia longiramus]